MSIHDEAATDLRAATRRRLLARRDFKVATAIFCAVAVLLLVIWLVTSPGGYFWPVWPILGVAVAPAFAALNAFGPARPPITDAEVEAEIARVHRR